MSGRQSVLYEVDPESGCWRGLTTQCLRSYNVDMTMNCDHVGTLRVNRVRTGYLYDTPRGVVDVLCTECGAVLDEEEAELDLEDLYA